MCEKLRQSVYTEVKQDQTQIRSPFISDSVILTLQLVSENRTYELNKKKPSEIKCKIY
jgi:hypothetical protein